MMFLQQPCASHKTVICYQLVAAEINQSPSQIILMNILFILKHLTNLKHKNKIWLKVQRTTAIFVSTQM